MRQRSRRTRPLAATRGSEVVTPGPTFCAPSMGATLRVQVPPRGDHPDRSEPQLREGDRPWGGSGERNRGPMDKNPIRGGAEWGERANDREAPMVEAQAT